MCQLSSTYNLRANIFPTELTECHGIIFLWIPSIHTVGRTSPHILHAGKSLPPPTPRGNTRDSALIFVKLCRTSRTSLTCPTKILDACFSPGFFRLKKRLTTEATESTEQLKEIKAQLLTYMKISGIKTGLLINFNTQSLKDGIRRRVL